MKRFLAFLLPVMLVGCGALSNPDGTPMTRDQIRAEIHDGLVAGQQVTKVAGEVGVPYAEVISGALGLLATLFGTTYAAKTSGDRHADVMKHVIAQGSVTMPEQVVVEKKVG